MEISFTFMCVLSKYYLTFHFLAMKIIFIFEVLFSPYQEMPHIIFLEQKFFFVFFLCFFWILELWFGGNDISTASSRGSSLEDVSTCIEVF